MHVLPVLQIEIFAVCIAMGMSTLPSPLPPPPPLPQRKRFSLISFIEMWCMSSHILQTAWALDFIVMTWSKCSIPCVSLLVIGVVRHVALPTDPAVHAKLGLGGETTRYVGKLLIDFSLKNVWKFGLSLHRKVSWFIDTLVFSH